MKLSDLAVVVAVPHKAAIKIKLIPKTFPRYAQRQYITISVKLSWHRPRINPHALHVRHTFWEQNNNRYLASFIYFKFRVFKFILVKQAAL